MKREFRPWFGLFAALVCAIYEPGAVAHDQFFKASDLRTVFRRADPKKETQLRPKVDGGHQTSFGIQFHPACFEYAKEEGMDRVRVEAEINYWVQRTVTSMVESCRARFPEFGEYIKQWISQFRRTVVTCTHKTSTDLKYSALNVSTEENLRKNLKKNEYVGIHDIGTGNGFSKAESLPRTNRTVLIYTRDAFMDALKNHWSDPHTHALLAHEVLHSTTANGRFDHGEIEFIKAGLSPKGACSADIVADRINVISALCTNAPIIAKEGGLTAAATLFDRMNGCGFEHGCRDVFSRQHKPENSEERELAYHYPSVPLNKESAEAVCSRLYDQGACDYARHTQGERITGVRLSKYNSVFGKRFAELFPANPAHPQLSAALLALYPEQKQKIKELRDQTCFKKLFFETPSGNLIVRSRRMKRYTRDNAGTYGKEMLDQVADVLSTVSECADPDSGGGQIRDALADIRRDVNLLLETSAFTGMLGPRIAGNAETYHEPVMRGASEEIARKLFGSRIWDEYLADLRRFHYRSPDFDCEATGLLPLKNLVSLTRRQASPSQNACDGKR